MRPRLVPLALCFLVLLASSEASAQVRHKIRFPDLPGYRTLRCDFHMHSVFSDGSVWPTVRVDEAWRLGLDCIALTDHIEYQPHRDDVPTNHNRPFELAAGRARERDVLLIHAAEITRDTPPGHFNAVFLKDANPLATEDLLEVMGRANEQGAFVFWNHHEWKGPEKGQWLEVHTKLYEKGWLKGIEVCNGESYYPQAQRWALEKGLTMIGNSDIHDPDLHQQLSPDDHRTLTLVFAKERTAESVKEALLEGRTAVWFGEQLIGKKEWLEKLFSASVTVAEPHLRVKDAVWLSIGNDSDIPMEMERTGGPGPRTLTLPAGAVQLVKVGTSTPQASLRLEYTVTNLLIAPETGLPVTLEIPGAPPADE